jgi:hypothetical protein
MSELLSLGCITGVATAGLIAAFSPLRSAFATVVAAILVPVLVMCVMTALRLAAFCTGACEPADAVGELDIWMAGIVVYGGCAAVICAARVVTWLTWKSGHLHALRATHNAD